ncbi:hypothetical protein O4H52_22275, partial [Sphingomonadaceae bacterium G21617-S1]|nr:hypothetical protein [Sphingomonadaceae bacterium G21617-S1]
TTSVQGVNFERRSALYGVNIAGRFTAGELLFRAEGALLARRRLWDVGRDLYLRSATVGCFMPPCGVPSGLALIREQLPALHQIRRDVLA